MREALLSLALLPCLAAGARAELKIVGETKVPAYHLVRLAAAGDVDGAALVWDIDREDAADVEEVGGKFIFTGPAGKYKVKLRAIRVKDGKATAEAARAVVTIGEPGPQPPGPGPGPTPPGPDDQLTRDLRAALAGDAGSAEDKKKWAGDLSALYAQAVKAADDSSLKTAGDLLGVLKKASATLLPPDALKGVRTRIQGELSAALPSDGAAGLTPEVRQKAKEVFSRVSKSLEALK